MLEEADGGDSGGTGLEAGGGIGTGDAAEGEDGDRGDEKAGLAENHDPCGWRDELAGDGFAEDGAEEDEVGVEAAGLFQIVLGVAGEADGGWREVGGGIDGSDLVWGK